MYIHTYIHTYIHAYVNIIREASIAVRPKKIPQNILFELIWLLHDGTL